MFEVYFLWGVANSIIFLGGYFSLKRTLETPPYKRQIYVSLSIQKCLETCRTSSQMSLLQGLFGYKVSRERPGESKVDLPPQNTRIVLRVVSRPGISKMAPRKGCCRCFRFFRRLLSVQRKIKENERSTNASVQSFNASVRAPAQQKGCF